MLRKMLPILLFLCYLPLITGTDCNPLKLDWATYPAVYDSNTKICKYQNVRFAGPPIGPFRFRGPIDPQPSDPQPPLDSSITCISVNTSDTCAPSGGDLVLGKTCKPPIQTTFTEDCLFLDIYVPIQAFESKSLIPVVVWFYGGAFVFGSKSEFDITKFPLYSGAGPIGAAAKPLIFVVGNYRLGAFGWLAGSYMEDNGLPNAGLYDQRKILEFVQTYISRVNGDPKAISAWGESAGAASILHHLIAENGTRDPLFSRAILQSPAYEWQWDRDGVLDQTYMQFADLAGCKDGNMECLQQASSNTLQDANQMIFKNQTLCNGVFPLGPSLDKNLTYTLPAVALSNEKYWPGLDSIIISHVNEEVKYNGTFIPYPIRHDPTEANFEKFLFDFMPQSSLAPLRAKIANQYPLSNYKGDQIARVGAVIQDSTFVCNTRQLFDAYSSRSRSSSSVYMMNYHFLAKYNLAVHGSDLIPTFFTETMDFRALLCNFTFSGVVKDSMTKFASSYQSYLTSHALYGNPNNGTTGGAKKVRWQPAKTSTDGNFVQKILEPYLPLIPALEPWFRLAGQDELNTRQICSFWTEVASEIMEAEHISQSGNLLTVQDPKSVGEL